MKLKSLEFRREREATWRELESLLGLIERKGLASLSADQLTRLPVLYRATLSSLSVARAISLDRNVLDYLANLSGRAYVHVYGTRRTLLETVSVYVRLRFPILVRKHAWALVLASFFMIAGIFGGQALVEQDQERYYAFVPKELAGGRDPSATTETLREALYDTGTPADTLLAFATFLFQHNSRVGMMSFALGFLAGVPVILLMLYNGLVLGAFSQLYESRGLGVDFWAWVLPHGVTELLAIVLCGAAGLVLARALVFPGPLPRLESLARGGREAGMIVIGAIGMLFFAGLIEGIFRQTVHDVAIRYSVASATAVFWLVYFGFVGRGVQR